jgi:hypothetical protein
MKNGVGRAEAQAVSHRLPYAVALIRARFKLCGICGGQGGTWVGFLRFPLPFIHSANCSTIIAIYHSGGYNRQINRLCSSGLGSIPAP